MKSFIFNLIPIVWLTITKPVCVCVCVCVCVSFPLSLSRSFCLCLHFSMWSIRKLPLGQLCLLVTFFLFAVSIFCFLSPLPVWCLFPTEWIALMESFNFPYSHTLSRTFDDRIRSETAAKTKEMTRKLCHKIEAFSAQLCLKQFPWQSKRHRKNFDIIKLTSSFSNCLVDSDENKFFDFYKSQLHRHACVH